MTPERRIPMWCGRLAFASLLLAPFAFGAVTFDVWIPLCSLWILLGLVTMATAREHPRLPRGVTRLALALHLLLAVQLVPLPASWLLNISAGSFAAHFLPWNESTTFAPITASPMGSRQAWFFLAGLHGLLIALFQTPVEARRRRADMILVGMAVVGGVLAVEGLVQLASPNPYWLYGVYQVPGAGSLENGIFGPYYNRDHYSNLIAIAGGVGAGIVGRALSRGGGRSLSAFSESRDFYATLAILASVVVMVPASAASGSRGGLLALAAGLAIGLVEPSLRRPKLAIGALSLFAFILFGTGIPSAIGRFADLDFEASRLMVWRDSLRVVSFFPLFGCGLGAFGVGYWPYQRVVRYEYWPHLHNEYLQWFLEAGLVGLFISIWVARGVWRAIPAIVRSDAARPAVAGAVAALVHAVVESGFRVPANSAWATVLLGIVALTIRGGDDKVRQTASTEP